MKDLISKHTGAAFRTPGDLAISPTPLHRVLVVGSCFAENLVFHVNRALPSCNADFVLGNHLGISESTPVPINEYDCQLIFLPLRSVLPEGSYSRMAYLDLAGWRDLFERARETQTVLLDACLRWYRECGLLTFVANFLVPQQNPMGRLLPRYDIRNPVYFVEELNKALYLSIEGKPNLHLLDVDQISASMGRGSVQDDSLLPISHGAFLGDWGYEYDQDRLEKPLPPSEHYKTLPFEFLEAIWHELAAQIRTLRRTDEVKLVIVDLDDTLWRGVAAEEALQGPVAREGWPLGVLEFPCFPEEARHHAGHCQQK